ncbi:MAG: hypothetical protein HW418_1904 [Anaerolineales bacterium]|nr:hypothetical protein [Anaerolineales bacterium]
MPLFGKKPSKKTTRLFFATDLHGSEVSFRKFINAARFYEADVLIMGGDVAGKLLVPIVKDSDGKYRARLQGVSEALTTEAELTDFKRKIGILGFYHIFLSPDEYAVMKDDKAAIEREFVKAARQRLADWVQLAEERLKGTPIRCYVTGGNDDPWEVLAAVTENAKEHVVACEGQVVKLDDAHSMISLGYSNETPWHTPREITEHELAEKIEEAVRGTTDFSHCIFNFHCPPKDSTLDTCAMLDTSTDPPTVIMEAGQPIMFGAGSTSVRAAIDRYQPLLALHGHIHESRGAIKIGRTQCLNPGSEYGEGILHGALVNLREGKIEGYQFTSG